MAGQKPGGVVQVFGPERNVEMHSSKCAHCQHITVFPSKMAMTDHVDVCRGCMRLICLNCVGKPCLTELKRMEIVEKQYHRQRMWADMGM